MTDVLIEARCPSCGHQLATLRDAPPWCPSCEHGLMLGGRLSRFAYRVTLDEFRRLDGAPEIPSGRLRWPGVVVTVASVLLHLLALGCLAVGVWLCTVSFPGFALVPGVLLVLLAVELRPRFGRLPKDVSVVEPGEAPALHALVAGVAAAVGAPAPQVICLAEDEFNASAGTVGWRRRRVLTIGLPLWLSLSPQERVAVLGHELGHFVNGDPRRSLLVQPVYRTLATLAELLRPAWAADHFSGLIGIVAGILMVVVMAPLRWIVIGVRLGLVALAERDGQRAEYRADVLAARAAGSTAAASMLDLLMLADSVLMLIKRDARAGVAPSDWRESAGRALVNARPNFALRRQLNVREEAGIFASHPPHALRARLIEGRPAESAAVVLDEATNARIEAELAKPIARCARTLKEL